MPSFAVETGALSALAARLDAVGQELAEAGRALQPTGAAGSAELDAALADFCEAWRRGLHRTGGAARTAAAQLHDAVRVYEQVDAAVAGACRG